MKKNIPFQKGNNIMKWKKQLLMKNPLDGRNTKKPKTKTADFFVNTHISVNFFSKKAKITISFFRRKSKNNNIILGFSFQFYVFGFS